MEQQFLNFYNATPILSSNLYALIRRLIDRQGGSKISLQEILIFLYVRQNRKN